MSVFHFVQPIISAAAKYVFSFAKLLALARHPYVRGTGSYEMRGQTDKPERPSEPATDAPTGVDDALSDAIGCQGYARGVR